MAPDKKSTTGRLAEYISNLQYEDLPAEVIQQAKKIILDALGCQVSCSLLENGRSIIKLGRAQGGPAEASVFGSDYKTSAINAAFVNGTLGHGDEIDDSLEEAGHVSAVIVPAAFACGEKDGASGRDLITAVVAGYDIAGGFANAGVSVKRLMIGYSDGYASVFWGVAAACNILKLRPDQVRIALGLSACQSGGFYDFSEAKHMAKSLMMGFGARNGTTAALLAQMNFDGPSSVFESDNNVLRYQIGENYNQQDLTENLGKKFVIMDTCIKLYSAGHPIHAPAYGLRKIMDREGINADDIQSIIVRLPEREKQIVDNRDMPDINIQYCLAVSAFDRQLSWDQFTPERLKDPKVADLKSRVLALHDPEMDERKKITKAHSAEIDVRTKDDRKFSERVDFPPGDPGNPATQMDVEKKVMHYASKVLGQDRTRKVIETVKNLDALPDLNELGNMLRIQK